MPSVPAISLRRFMQAIPPRRPGESLAWNLLVLATGVLLRYGVLAFGATLLWLAGVDGGEGWFLPAGLLVVALSAFLRVPLWLVAIGSMAWSLRYLAFLLPLLKGAANLPWAKVLPAWIAASAWEALPFTAALLAGVVLARRNAKGWTVMLVTAAIWTGLSIWVLRPYGFAPVAPVFRALPGLIWTFGCDLAGGLLLGWGIMILSWAFRPTTGKEIGWALGATAFVLLTTHMGYQHWTKRCSGMARKVTPHEVVAIPGAMPPFAANFSAQTDRLIYPMVLNSSTLPDLVMAPENAIQANVAMDPPDENSVTQRHVTAIGIGIGVPFSQALYGVRDITTARVYFTDLVDGKPRVQWKDLERRIPGLDYPIPKVQKFFPSEAYTPAIRPAEKTPLMDLWKRKPDSASPNGVSLTKMGRALICMSGEIRNPRLLDKMQDRTITVAMNPNISGWLGYPEGVGASIQAKARLLELGLLGYRVGQNSGTELVVPWVLDEIPTTISPRKEFLRFQAPVPAIRIPTGYELLGSQLAHVVVSLGALLLVAFLLRGFSFMRQFRGLV